MAKLDELKALLERAKAERDAKRGAEGTARPGVPPPDPRRRTGAGRVDPNAGRLAAVPSRRDIAASKHADGDVDIARAFADVTRLPPANRARVTKPRPAPIPQHTLADEREVLDMAKYGDEPAPQSWEVGQEFEGDQNYLRPGLGTDVLSKLRRGHWTVQAEHDLHGFTSEEARDALADFLLEARGRGFRCVRVIHGKGLTSPNREPILKGRVRRWLAQWDDVLAFSEAPRHSGGGGAVLVLLRGR